MSERLTITLKILVDDYLVGDDPAGHRGVHPAYSRSGNHGSSARSSSSISSIPRYAGLTRLPLWASILVVYALVLGLIAIALAFVVPSLIANLQGLVHDAPVFVHKTQAAIEDPHNRLLARLPVQAQSYCYGPRELALLLEQYGGQATTRALRSWFPGIRTSVFVVIPI